MSKQESLMQSLIDSFSLYDQHVNVTEILKKYSTEWIQSQHVTQKMNGYVLSTHISRSLQNQIISSSIIDKFEIQGQSNKHKALKSCFNHYQTTQNHNDENYCHIIHLLLSISEDPLHQNNGKIFRDLAAINKQIESTKIDQRQQDDFAISLLSDIASEQLSEVRHTSSIKHTPKKI